jgi:hypothetical protein
MRSILPILRYLLAVCVLPFTTAFAADSIGWKPLPVGGLNVSLATSGYSFREVTTGPVIQIFPPIPGARSSFVASVALSNRSRSPITFSFNDAGPQWTFRVLNSADQEVWRSDGDIAPQVITEDVLGPGKTWKRSARIPLVIDDSPLAVGVYTLQAFLNADKPVSATSVFEIVPGEGSDTGIKGRVEKWITSGNGQVGVSYGVPGAGARVTVTAINARTTAAGNLFFWSGVADAEGKFKVNTPPGRYRVAASTTNIDPAVTFTVHNVQIELSTAVEEVTVQQGSFTEVTLRTYEFKPIPITQGIKGTVSYPPIQPGIDDTQSADKIRIIQLGSFSVRVEQIETPAGQTPFTWSGVTDFAGRFQVATPPGRFRVFATTWIQGLTINGIPSTIMAPSAFAEATVEANAVATVALVLSPGCVYPPVTALDQ